MDKAHNFMVTINGSVFTGIPAALIIVGFLGLIFAAGYVAAKI